MKLIIFGSTGGVGRQLVSQALEQGHDVTAFMRSPQNFDQRHERLQVVQGDVLDPISIERAIQGHDAVLCALGMPLMNKDGLRTAGTKNIIQAMESVGIKKLVCLSALGVGDGRETLPFHYKYFIVPFILRHVFADHEVQESYVKKSLLDWVIVRPGNYAKGERTGAYRHGIALAGKALKLKVSRGDVAEFMLKQVSDETYLHQSPYMSY